MFKKFRIKITILASLIITAYCFFMKINFLRTCYSIIATIVIFYIVGTIVEMKIKKYLEKNCSNNKLENDENLEEFQDSQTEDDLAKEQLSFADGGILPEENYEQFLENDEFYDINTDDE